MKKDIAYPTEITFKSVFACNATIALELASILDEHGIIGQITHRNSRNSKFISYTITAEFASESHLEELCARISSLQGFVIMF